MRYLYCLQDDDCYIKMGDVRNRKEVFKEIDFFMWVNGLNTCKTSIETLTNEIPCWGYKRVSGKEIRLFGNGAGAAFLVSRDGLYPDGQPLEADAEPDERFRKYIFLKMGLYQFIAMSRCQPAPGQSKIFSDPSIDPELRD